MYVDAVAHIHFWGCCLLVTIKGNINTVSIRQSCAQSQIHEAIFSRLDLTGLHRALTSTPIQHLLDKLRAGPYHPTSGADLDNALVTEW